MSILATASFVALMIGFAAAGAYALWSTPDVNAHIASAQRLLKQAKNTRTVPRNSPIARAPLPVTTDTQTRKDLFIAKMLPLIVRENRRILAQRAEAQTLRRGTPRYGALAYGYGLKPTVSRAGLLRRIDIVPVALALAQAAIESAWGTSRFAHGGHAYFGERTYAPSARGLVPKAAQGFKVKSFAAPFLSVRSYMKTLNTHRAYDTFRARRAALRAKKLQPTGLTLASTLVSYSEIGPEYPKRLVATIKSNRLWLYNDVTFAED